MSAEKFLNIFLILLGISFLQQPKFAPAQEKQKPNHANINKAAYMGVGSCSSSNCHGSVSPRNAAGILQNEYVTWEKHDLHSKAWINLSNQDSKKIAKNLGIASAEKEPLCLKCHATYIGEDSRQSSNYHIEDGVGCESCHGAAENYLGPHTAKDSTHASNLERGMSDLLGTEKRIKLCASCHFGTEDKFVNHRLIGAGHPRLSFELDTFSMIQPRHWIVDEDYQSRKGGYNSTEAWLSGQIYLSKQIIDRLASKKLSRDGIFPELTIFYCYSCHHSLSEEQWKVREYDGKPGELQINLSSLIIVREALNALDKKLGEKLGVEILKLHNGYKNGVADNFSVINSTLDKAAALFDKSAQSRAAQLSLLRALSAYGAEQPHLQYEVAEQIIMGISSITATIAPEGNLHKAEIDRIYKSLANPKAFVAEDFTSACKNLLAVL